MRRNMAKQKEYQKKYMGRHKMLCVSLDKEKDKDIIEWLERHENQSRAVRKALRTVMVLKTIKEGRE